MTGTLNQTATAGLKYGNTDFKEAKSRTNSWINNFRKIEFEIEKWQSEKKKARE
jgi:hypothetical protein